MWLCASMCHGWKSKPTRRQRCPTVWRRGADLRLSPERAGGWSLEQDGRASRSGSAAYPLSYCREKETPTSKTHLSPANWIHSISLHAFMFLRLLQIICLNTFSGGRLSSRKRNCKVTWKVFNFNTIWMFLLFFTCSCVFIWKWHYR